MAGGGMKVRGPDQIKVLCSFPSSPWNWTSGSFHWETIHIQVTSLKILTSQEIGQFICESHQSNHIFKKYSSVSKLHGHVPDGAQTPTSEGNSVGKWYPASLYCDKSWLPWAKGTDRDHYESLNPVLFRDSLGEWPYAASQLHRDLLPKKGPREKNMGSSSPSLPTTRAHPAESHC